MNVKFYEVGGCVRDEILGVKSKDIDYSVEAPSFDAMRDEIVDRGGKIFLETPQYFTIRAKVPKMGACDFVLCRKESEYSDGRHPDKVEMGTLFDDLARRDFTMNAIAKNEAGILIDPHDGAKDISERIIRCVGKAEDRFSEDYLRILRAMRFSVTKDMGLSDDVYYAIEKHKDKVMEVSVERVREELVKAFKFDTIKTLAWLHEFEMEYIVFDEKYGLRLKPTLEK